MKFAITGSKFLRIPNNPPKYCPRLFNFNKCRNFAKYDQTDVDEPLVADL